MHVLFLTKHDVRRYGIAEVMRRLAKQLRPLGVRVTIASSDPSADPEFDQTDRSHHDDARPALAADRIELEKPELQPRTIRLVWPRPGRLGSRRRLRQVVARLAAEPRPIDLIHAHGLHHAGAAAIAIGERLGTPVVVTSHGDIASARRRRRRRFRRQCAAVLSRADAVTHLGPTMRGWAREIRDVSEKERVIPNGVDLAAWTRARERASEGPVGRYVAAVGRLDVQKGGQVLVDAVGQLQRFRDGSSGLGLLFVGDGGEREALSARARSRGLSVVSPVSASPAVAPVGPGEVGFAGYLQGEAMREAVCRASVFAFASQFGEVSPPLALLEGMASGRPIVASDIPAAQSVLTSSRQAQLVPADDPDAWARALRRVLDDPSRAAEAATENLNVVRAYDWSAIARRYHELYVELLSRSVGGP